MRRWGFGERGLGVEVEELVVFVFVVVVLDVGEFFVEG